MKILKSLVVIGAVAALTVGATGAVFTSQATVAGNTFSTGILEIRVNGGHSTAGFSYPNAAPGGIATKTFTLMNYDQPRFAGPSTLAAKEIIPAAVMTSGDAILYNALQVRLYANAGWSGCSNPGTNPFVPGKGCTVYNGPLSGLTGTAAQDILHATYWGSQAELAAGNSLTMLMEVELPVSADDTLQGKTTTFDLGMTAYNPHR